MQAIDILMQEHRLIERVLDALESAASQLDRSHAVAPAFFLDAADFIAGFADGCHHRKEEGVLFGAMIESGVPSGGGVIDMFLDEHQQGRALTRALRDAARRLQAGDAAARAQVVSTCAATSRCCATTSRRKTRCCSRWPTKCCLRAGQERVLAGFDRVEREETGEGAHEKFHALAEKLEREAKELAG